MTKNLMTPAQLQRKAAGFNLAAANAAARQAEESKTNRSIPKKQSTVTTTTVTKTYNTVTKKTNEGYIANIKHRGAIRGLQSGVF